MDLRSPLKKVKGLGSAHNGLHHWWMQRVTAVALIPLVICFVMLVIRASLGAESLIDYLGNPFFAVSMILFLGVALYHGCLGIRVVIEDYVHCNCSKTILINAINFFSIITAVAAILAVAYSHIGGFTNMAKTHKIEQAKKVEAEANAKWEEEIGRKLQEHGGE